MKLIIDIPEEEYNECKMQVEMIRQEGILVESLNTALKIHVANGKVIKERERDCKNCIHHSDEGCEVWDCSFEPKEDDE